MGFADNNRSKATMHEVCRVCKKHGYLLLNMSRTVADIDMQFRLDSLK